MDVISASFRWFLIYSTEKTTFFVLLEGKLLHKHAAIDLMMVMNESRSISDYTTNCKSSVITREKNITEQENEGEVAPQYSLTGQNTENMQIQTEFSSHTRLHTILLGRISFQHSWGSSLGLFLPRWLTQQKPVPLNGLLGINIIFMSMHKSGLNWATIFK